MLKTKGDSLRGKICAVSGAGNVAQYTIEKLLEMGAKVVTCSDSNGYIRAEQGLERKDLESVLKLKNIKRGRVKELVDEFACEYYEDQKPWSVKCDIAFPCATQNEIDEKDAKMLVENGCIAVGEGANMPTTPAGVEVFQTAKILYAPGKASNAGGVSTSGLEMTQNNMRLAWSREEVDQKLRSIMVSIHNQCVKYGTQDDGYVDYVKGANIAGFVKVADAMIDQGIV